MNMQSVYCALKSIFLKSKSISQTGLIKTGTFMNRPVVLVCLIFCFWFSCEHTDDQQLFNNLHDLEWARVPDTTAYHPFHFSRNPELRAELCLSLGKVQSPDLFPILADLTHDPDSRVVRNAIFALGQMRDDQSVNLLITLFSDPHFTALKTQIISALGKSENNNAYDFMIGAVNTVEDSILAELIRSVAYLTKDETRKRSGMVVNRFLTSPLPAVRKAAVYYYARHADPFVLAPLIRCDLGDDTLAVKYRYRAIERSFSLGEKVLPDSSLMDSLSQEIKSALKQGSLSWRTRLYQIGILGIFRDSIATELIAKQLQDTIPHIRLKAIQTLGQKNDENAHMILLAYYNDASWAEKGNIILAMSRYDKNLAYRLIQQNLDQGTLYFKKLLLQSLARIRDYASIAQLRQFLIVPNIPLQQTAFTELNALDRISYKDVLPLLESRDLALVWLAADWIGSHPDKGLLSDLTNVYNRMHENVDYEPMLAILSAISAMKDRRAIPFLQTALEKTGREDIKDEIVKILTALDVKLKSLPQTNDSLFIPPEIVDAKTQVEILIETDKGDITLRLRPDMAPLTVSNFIYLINRRFYHNMLVHRVVSDFVIQSGDPRGDGWGGPGYSIPCEYNMLHFERGTIGMATAGKDTGGSQFFICHSEQPHLDRRYTAFGQVIQGMDVVDQIEVDDQIIQISRIK
jgi:cyclophilin family peptidyl-prolyl cis-trans isomerase/HEAT repeat protein